jgi:hypothetical protein
MFLDKSNDSGLVDIGGTYCHLFELLHLMANCSKENIFF